MIEITVNGERKTLPRPLSVQELLRQIGLDPRKVAAEVNYEIIPRTHHAERHLQAGDAVEIVTLVGGGEQPATDKPLKIGTRDHLPSDVRESPDAVPLAPLTPTGREEGQLMAVTESHAARPRCSPTTTSSGRAQSCGPGRKMAAGVL